ncbi:MAG: NYN domain-containing protein [Alphaproteobacteria bacterium]
MHGALDSLWMHRAERRPLAAVFFDGRNIRHAATRSFGNPNHAHFHPGQLAERLCDRMGWSLHATHFYIGVPPEGRMIGRETARDWLLRTRRWARGGVTTCTRPLTGTNRERGIDLRMGFDILRVFESAPIDVVVIASGDQDFQEAVAELKDRAQCLARTLTIATAFPVGPRGPCRGVDTADVSVPLTSLDFAACRDLLDHRLYALARAEGDTAPAQDGGGRMDPFALPPIPTSLHRPQTGGPQTGGPQTGGPQTGGPQTGAVRTTARPAQRAGA